jgi:hypothetical protein
MSKLAWSLVLPETALRRTYHERRQASPCRSGGQVNPQEDQEPPGRRPGAYLQLEMELNAAEMPFRENE